MLVNQRTQPKRKFDVKIICDFDIHNGDSNCSHEI